jgi:hypothetical protein
MFLMTRFFGFILLLIGLAGIQIGGVMAFSGGGGKDFEDLLRFDWIQNVGGGRMPKDAMMWLGIGGVGALVAIIGLVKLLRGKKS